MKNRPWLIHGGACITTPIGSSWEVHEISLEQAKAIASHGLRSGLTEEVEVQRLGHVLGVTLQLGQCPSHLEVGDTALIAYLDLEAAKARHARGLKVSLDWAWSEAIRWRLLRRTK